MPRDERLFGDVVEPSVKMGNRQRTSVAVTIVLETLLVAVFVTIPLMAVDVLPAAPDMMGAFVTAEAPPAPPPPPPAGVSSPRPSSAEPEVIEVDAAPVEAPDAVMPERFAAPTDTSFERGGSPGVPDGVPGGTGDVDGGLVGAPPRPPSPPVKKEAVPVGGNVLPPRKIKDVRPVYPQLAQRAGVQGRVIIQATIDTNGRVINVEVLQSRPLLDQAAIDAVRQWEFTPTLLNGEPTAVIMSVTVNFQLN